VRLLRTAFGNRAIARVEASWAGASLATWTFSIALALYAYYEDGPIAVGLAVAVRMLPAGLFAPAAARLARARSRRDVLVASALARGLVMETIALAVHVDAPFALVLALAAAFELAGAVHKPVRAALLVDLARTPAELAAANAARTVDYVGFLGGALVAGAVTSLFGLDAAFATSGAIFLALTALVWRLPGGASAPRRDPLGRLAGLRMVARHPWMRLRLGLFGASVLVQSMLELLLVVAAVDMLAIGDGGVGWLRAAFAAGGLLGAAAAVALLGRGRLALGLASGLALAGVPLALVAAWPEPAPALILLAVLGAGYAVLEAALLILSQRLLAAEAFARVLAVEELAYPVARATGAMLAAWLVIALGDDAALVVSGLLLPALGLASLRALHSAERAVSVPERAFGLLRGLPVFAGLPRATVENLALRASTEHFDAGEAIPGAERDGRCLYVIDAGTVELAADGRPPGRLHEGGCFGEECLLGAAPREAGASAVTPVTTLTLARDDLVGVPL
jgi:hypothetical protein